MGAFDAFSPELAREIRQGALVRSQVFGEGFVPPEQPRGATVAFRRFLENETQGLIPARGPNPFEAFNAEALTPEQRGRFEGLSDSDMIRFMTANPNDVVDLLSGRDFDEKVKTFRNRAGIAPPPRLEQVPANSRVFRFEKGADPEQIIPVDRAAQKPFSVLDRQTGKPDLISADTFAADPNRYTPVPKSDDSTDPAIKANRRSSLRASIRKNKIKQLGLSEIPGLGLVDITTGKVGRISAQRLKALNASVEDDFQIALGEKPKRSKSSTETSAFQANSGLPEQEQINAVAAFLKKTTGRDPSKAEMQEALKLMGFDLSR